MEHIHHVFKGPLCFLMLPWIPSPPFIVLADPLYNAKSDSLQNEMAYWVLHVCAFAEDLNGFLFPSPSSPVSCG